MFSKETCTLTLFSAILNDCESILPPLKIINLLAALPSSIKFKLFCKVAKCSSILSIIAKTFSHRLKIDAILCGISDLTSLGTTI